MALNKFMHSRNIYKTPPDFCKLFKEFKDFASVAKIDVTGKVSIDFKDPQALRVLTKCLLKSDFGLDVVIPEDRLVPTLPLRLNYILWIEDLMNSIGKKDTITGLDIGTGACAIYPLLAAVKNKWNMIGTEKDKESLQKAKENIERNNLQHLIKLRNNETATLIQYLFNKDDGLKVDFCMCNPPFYSNVQDLWESRSPARPPPKNGFTGSPQELITEGGELEFCRKLIKESIQYQNNVNIFTTMIGHKYNMKELEIDLKSENIKYTTTEFCQGRVTRWGLAWTFQEFDIYNLVPPRDKPRKKSLPIKYVLPELENQCYNVENITEKIKTMLTSLDITYSIITTRKNETILNFIALKNTWSNQRRKRRLQKQIGEESSKKSKLEEHKEASQCENSSINLVENCALSEPNVVESALDDDNPSCTKKNIEDKHDNSIATEDCSGIIVVQGIMKITTKANAVCLELEFIDGCAGKEGIHQILQYIKNNWK